MTENKKNQEIFQSQDEYQYGFYDENTTLFTTGKGLTRDTVITISKIKGEPDWVLDYRLKAFEAFEKMPDQLTEFALETWHSRVDFATVYSENDIRFTFKNGQEVRA